MMGGPSSKIFWNLRCVEQSRPFRATAFPYSSPTIWTSRCLAPVHSCIMKIGEPGTSFCTWMNWFLSSEGSCTMRMPLPPPPSEALIITGYPISSATTAACSGVNTHALSKTSLGICPFASRPASMPWPDQGMEGTFAVCARMLADTLSPNAAMTDAVGPMNWIPLLFRVDGRRGFSEACPQPGQTASTLWATAMSTMRSTLA
mmetsp:Transcript_33206/g.73178  ORF Transcript_33206/g.73178 Transcript_33206/m.73178 type:complete len:203 (-) Transcript_33206:475-1083(-)